MFKQWYYRGCSISSEACQSPWGAKQSRCLLMTAFLLATLGAATAEAAPPLAMDDTATCQCNDGAVIPVTINDDSVGLTIEESVNPSSVTIVQPPAHGVAIVDAMTGEVLYIPDTNFIGTDVFYYTVANYNGETSNVAEVVVTVVLNTPPRIVSLSVAHDGAGGWIFSGQVADEAPQWASVTLTGYALYAPVTTFTDENGDFEVTVPLRMSGAVDAVAKDVLGAESEPRSIFAGW